MWQQLISFAKQLFTLTREVEQSKETIKEIRQDLRSTREELN